MTTSVYPTIRDSGIYRDALIDARPLSTDALLSEIDHNERDLLDDDPDWPGDVGRYIAGERLRALCDELERRARLARLSPRQTVDFAAWRETARRIRERVELPFVFELAGYLLQPAGMNGRRGVPEYAGACPVCGGTDRLRVWGGPNGRAWCRRCDWSGDVFTVSQSLFQESFRDSVRRLASYVETAGAA